MATIINNPRGESESSGVLFAIGLIILLIIGAVLLMNYLPAATEVREEPNQPGINIDVVAPTPAPTAPTPAPAEPAPAPTPE